MKLKRRRKLVQARIHHNNAWNWAFEKFLRRVVEVCRPFRDALAEAYLKAHKERAQHDHTG